MYIAASGPCSEGSGGRRPSSRPRPPKTGNITAWTGAGGFSNRITSRYSWPIAAIHSGSAIPTSFTRPWAPSDQRTSIIADEPLASPRPASGGAPAATSTSTITRAIPSPEFHQSCTVPGITSATPSPGRIGRSTSPRRKPTSPSTTSKRSISGRVAVGPDDRRSGLKEQLDLEQRAVRVRGRRDYARHFAGHRVVGPGRLSPCRQLR